VRARNAEPTRQQRLPVVVKRSSRGLGRCGCQRSAIGEKNPRINLRGFYSLEEEDPLARRHPPGVGAWNKQRFAGTHIGGENFVQYFPPSGQSWGGDGGTFGHAGRPEIVNTRPIVLTSPMDGSPR
jgi:hypothetical protein